MHMKYHEYITCVVLPDRSSPSRTMNAPRRAMLLPRVEPDKFMARSNNFYN